MKESLFKILSWIFTATLALFMLMGALIVVVQLLGVILGNGAMVLGINSAVKTYAIWVSAICGFAGFFAAYLNPKKKSKE